MENVIRSLIYSRIKSLIAQSNGLTQVPHNLTKGELRERLLHEFFADLLPQRYTLCSGFVTDSQGLTSPQIDFIIAETLDIPRIVLDREISLVPVEAMRAIVEIKTSINVNDLGTQLDAQMKAFANFIPRYWSAQHSEFHARVYAIAFDAQKEKMLKYMQENEKLRACCIAGQYSLVRHELFQNNEQVVLLEDRPDIDNYEATATFVACLFRDLETVTLMHSPHYQLASLFWTDPTTQPLAKALLGKRWFWEEYVSETIAEAARKWSESANGPTISQ